MEALNGLHEAIGLIVEDPMNIHIVLFIAATAFFIVLNFQLSKVSVICRPVVVFRRRPVPNACFVARKEPPAHGL